MLAPGGRGGGGGFGQTLFKLSVGGMYRFLKSLGMDVGGEFVAAMEEADRIGARCVVLRGGGGMDGWSRGRRGRGGSPVWI